MNATLKGYTSEGTAMHFQGGEDTVIADALIYLRDRLTHKEYNGFYAILKRSFELYGWNGHDLNRIAHYIVSNKIEKLPLLLEVVSAYSEIKQAPVFFYKPFALLAFRYGALRNSFLKRPQPWKREKLTGELLGAMAAQGSFGNPESLVGEFRIEEERRSLI